MPRYNCYNSSLIPLGLENRAPRDYITLQLGFGLDIGWARGEGPISELVQNLIKVKFKFKKSE